MTTVCRWVITLMGLAMLAPTVAAEGDSDPLEGFNRRVYAFNDFLDRRALVPITEGYLYIAPEPVEDGVGRFFYNISEVPSFANSVLQLKPKKASHNAARFAINATFGLLGLFDVASAMGIHKVEQEDFGQTLGRYGVPAGPYLVLPFFGPSTLRDGPSILVDNNFSPTYRVEPLRDRLGLISAGVINTRAGLLDASRLLSESPDPYLFLRETYLDKRKSLVKDGEVEEDTFGEDLDF